MWTIRKNIAKSKSWPMARLIGCALPPSQIPMMKGPARVAAVTRPMSIRPGSNARSVASPPFDQYKSPGVVLRVDGVLINSLS